ncbi:MAG TPA: hypothetical protein VLT60_10475 [Usitatibacter sp.]|nr:hypothetical protein [Usitatibacter sp.]
MTAAKPFRLETKDLAEKLYVDLIGRNVVITEGSVKMAASAENVAKLCFKLAESFLTVQDGLNAENLPKDPTFKLGVEDIAGWMK